MKEKPWSQLTQSERLDRILAVKLATEEVETETYSDDSWKAFEYKPEPKGE